MVSRRAGRWIIQLIKSTEFETRKARPKRRLTLRHPTSWSVACHWRSRSGKVERCTKQGRNYWIQNWQYVRNLYACLWLQAPSSIDKWNSCVRPSVLVMQATRFCCALLVVRRQLTLRLIHTSYIELALSPDTAFWRRKSLILISKLSKGASWEMMSCQIISRF